MLDLKPSRLTAEGPWVLVPIERLKDVALHITVIYRISWQDYTRLHDGAGGGRIESIRWHGGDNEMPTDNA